MRFSDPMFNPALKGRLLMCGYCGARIMFIEVLDTSDLDRGFDHVATPLDWGFPDCKPTGWRHV